MLRLSFGTRCMQPCIIIIISFPIIQGLFVSAGVHSVRLVMLNRKIAQHKFDNFQILKYLALEREPVDIREVGI